MRCKSCNKIFGKDDWIFNNVTDEHDELCFKCRSIADIALFELEDLHDEQGNTGKTTN